MPRDAPSSTPCVVNARGRRLYAAPGDARGDSLIASGGDFNPGSLQLWQATLNLRPWDVVVDVGANYGEMLLGVDIPETARVIAFEPNPIVLPYLKRSIAESGMDLDLREKAVGACPADVQEFVLDKAWSGVSGLRESHRSPLSTDLSVVQVPVTTLSTELADLPREASVCIKVDVEGAERAVLEGAGELLRHRAHWAMMIEVLHMSDLEIHALANEHRAGMLDVARTSIIGVPRATEEASRNWVNASWLYRQDLVLMSDAVARERIEGLRA